MEIAVREKHSSLLCLVVSYEERKKRFFDVAIRPVPLSAEPGVVIVEDDVDEELLVDDFDGQCCRTYPNNHSKILAWRRSKEEKLKSAAPPTVEKTKPTQISGAGAIKLFFPGRWRGAK